MPAPLSTRQIILLSYSKTLFTMFWVLMAQLSQIISVDQHFYPALRQQGFPKFMRAGDSSKLEISKTFYTHYTVSCFFQFWRDTDLENNFFWGQVISIFTPFSHRQLFISVCCQTTYQTDVMNNFFLTNIIQKEFNLLHTEQVHSWLRPSLLLVLWAFYRASVLTHAVDLWQVQPGHKFTNTFWPWKGILSNCMYFSVQEEGFPVWPSLLLSTSFCEFWHV